MPDCAHLSRTDPAAWQASLRLRFADDAGTTRLVERSHSGPLQVQKPLYPEGARICHAIMIHPPGGIVGGDRLAIDAIAKGLWWNGCRRRPLFLTTQVRMEHSVTLAAGASYIGCEILCFGRSASGERFESGSIAQRTQIRQGGKLLWWEQGRLAGGSAAMGSVQGLGGASVCATLIGVGTPLPGALLAGMRAIDPALAVTQVKSVFVARYLCSDSQTARAVMTRAWQALRPHLLGVAAPVPRIWNT